MQNFCKAFISVKGPFSKLCKVFRKNIVLRKYDCVTDYVQWNIPTIGVQFSPVNLGDISFFYLLHAACRRREIALIIFAVRYCKFLSRLRLSQIQLHLFTSSGFFFSIDTHFLFVTDKREDILLYVIFIVLDKIRKLSILLIV